MGLKTKKINNTLRLYSPSIKLFTEIKHLWQNIQGGGNACFFPKILQSVMSTVLYSEQRCVHINMGQ